MRVPFMYIHTCV